MTGRPEIASAVISGRKRAWQDSLLSMQWMFWREMKRRGSPEARPYSMRALRPSASEHAVLMLLQADTWHGSTLWFSRE